VSDRLPPTTYSLADLGHDALAGIAQRPGRTVLTMLGTVLGVGALVSILGLTATAAHQIDDRFSVLAATTVEVADAGSGNPADVRISFPKDGDEVVQALPGVLHAGQYWPVPLTAPVRATPGVGGAAGAAGTSTSTTLTAADPDALAAMGAQVSVGRLYGSFHEGRAEPVAVLGSAAARELGIKRLDVPRAVFVGDHAYTVVGILKDLQRHPELLFSVIVPTSRAVADFGPPQLPRAGMLVQTKLGAAQVVAHEVAVALRPDAAGFLKVTAPADPTTLRGNVAGDVNSLFLVLAAIALIAGALGIATTTLVAVMERVSEIGLRRALGAGRRHIVAQFLAESLAIGTVGGLAGTSLGIVVLLGTSLARQWTPVVDARQALLSPLLGSVIGLLAGSYPALRAARIEPVEALRR